MIMTICCLQVIPNNCHKQLQFTSYPLRLVRVHIKHSNISESKSGCLSDKQVLLAGININVR